MYYDRKRKKVCISIEVDYTRVFLGRYNTVEEAVEVLAIAEAILKTKLTEAKIEIKNFYKSLKAKD